jgi:hypothetical protein
MSDISKCNGVNKEGVICPKREKCHRYTSEGDKFWQSWIEAPFTLDHEFRCDLFWGDHAESIFNQLKAIVKNESDTKI